MRQTGSSIRTDQTNLAAGRPAASFRAKTAASAAVTRTIEPFSSSLRDRAGSAVRRVAKSHLADCRNHLAPGPLGTSIRTKSLTVQGCAT